MATRTIGILLLTGLLLSISSGPADAGGKLTYYNGYAVFDYGVSTGAGPQASDMVTLEAHARGSNAGITAADSIIVRVEFPRPLLPLTGEPAYGVLVLTLPGDVLDVQDGSLQGADGFFDALYYEVAADDNARLFTTHRWAGELSWLHPSDPGDGDLRLITRLRIQDDGPDGVPDTGDDRYRDLTSATIRLFRTLGPVPLPQGNDVYVPDDEIYIEGAVVTYYDDGCSDDPTVDSYDEYDESGDTSYYSDDSGCDGDTSDDDSGGGDDDWDSDTDWGGWDGDDWASPPRSATGRIRGMALPGAVLRILRIHRRPLRVALPLLLSILFTLGLKRITRRRLRII